MAKKGKKSDSFLLYPAMAAVVLLLTFAGYQVLRRGAGRLFGDFFYPYLAANTIAKNTVSDQTLLLLDKVELAAKLEAVLERNRQLTAQTADTTALLRENDELRTLLKLPPGDKWKHVIAEIILRDPLLWQMHFTVNTGSDAGVMPGAAVMTATVDGRLLFIGVVDKVTTHTAQVMTVLNPGLKMSARIGNRDAVGVLNDSSKHLAAGMIPIGYLPVNETYITSEIVVTSGFEKNIPPGIKIGELATVEEINTPFSNSLYLNGTVKAAAQLNSIRFVVIAKRDEAK